MCGARPAGATLPCATGGALAALVTPRRPGRAPLADLADFAGRPAAVQSTELAKSRRRVASPAAVAFGDPVGLRAPAPGQPAQPQLGLRPCSRIRDPLQGSSRRDSVSTSHSLSADGRCKQRYRREVIVYILLNIDLVSCLVHDGNSESVPRMVRIKYRGKEIVG